MPTYRTIPSLSAQDITRFEKHINKTLGQGPQGECWTWIGHLEDDGYARFWVTVKPKKYIQIPAHRIAFFLYNGHILMICASVIPATIVSV